ncbi:MAG: RluA family pseudouridine synthase [Holosporaceae bacterium]|jgi:23S rRNA pseudouridine955/2504/2580 synthase|nr:RluA family pseudouridine synthase [Holosporaceae bacterium]
MEHIVTSDEDNLRADKIVGNISSELGYASLQKLFRLHKIKVNNKKISAADRLHAGDVVRIFANLTEKPKDVSVFNPNLFNKLKSMIIYEDENFFAINKPPKLAVQLGTKITTCVETFIKSYPDCSCHLVHRLDQDTSGVLLIAKNQKFARKLTELFRENKIKKTYLAVVDGKVSQAGTIDNFLLKSFVGDQERMRVSPEGQRSITNYRPLKIIAENYTLLELNPQTGRKHQLRVHCAEVLRAPVLGDRKYHPNPRHKELFLHAHKVFIDDLKIEITADIPSYFSKFGVIL